MKSKLLQEEAGTRTFAVIFDTGDETMEGLLDFAKRERLAASHLTAIGAFERATLGYYDLDVKEYAQIAVEEQVEVLSLVGDITRDDEENPKIYAHVVAGRRLKSWSWSHRRTCSVSTTNAPTWRSSVSSAVPTLSTHTLRFEPSTRG